MLFEYTYSMLFVYTYSMLFEYTYWYSMLFEYTYSILFEYTYSMLFTGFEVRTRKIVSRAEGRFWGTKTTDKNVK